MPKKTNVLRKIELTQAEMRDLDLRDRHMLSEKLHAPSKVIMEVIPHAYDKLDKIHKETSFNKRITDLSHSREASHEEDGYVISFKNAGSGFQFFPNMAKVSYTGDDELTYQNKKGKIKTSSSYKKIQKIAEKIFGRHLTTKDSSTKISKKHIYMHRVKNPNGTSTVKFNMAGPLGGKSINVPGLANTGDYRITNLTNYIVQLGSEEINKILQEEKKRPRKPGEPLKTIHLDFRGHSRGGVATLEGAMALNYELKQKLAPEDYNRIVFDIIQYDPVPGFGSRKKNRDTVNIIDENQQQTDSLKDMHLLPFKTEQVNSTVVYSIHQQHFSPFFVPEQVFGASRLILTLTEHDVNLLGTGTSREIKDGKAEPSELHRSVYTLASDGTQYRSTGISGLNNGLYVADEKNNLIQITSVKQLQEIIDKIHVSVSKKGQTGRYTRLLTTAERFLANLRKQKVEDQHDQAQQDNNLENNEHKPQEINLNALKESGKFNLNTVQKIMDNNKNVSTDTIIQSVSTNLIDYHVNLQTLIENKECSVMEAKAKKHYKKSDTYILETNHREYLSRRAIKSYIAATAYDAEATKGLSLDGLGPNLSYVLFSHEEGSRMSNKEYAEAFNLIGEDYNTKNQMIRDRIKQLVRDAKKELNVQRTDEELITNLDTVYSRLQSFQMLNKALQEPKNKNISLNLDAKTQKALADCYNKSYEIFNRINIITSPCYRYIDIDAPKMLTSKSLNNFAKNHENGNIARYMKTAEKYMKFKAKNPVQKPVVYKNNPIHVL